MLAIVVAEPFSAPYELSIVIWSYLQLDTKARENTLMIGNDVDFNRVELAKKSVPEIIREITKRVTTDQLLDNSKFKNEVLNKNFNSLEDFTNELVKFQQNNKNSMKDGLNIRKMYIIKDSEGKEIKYNMRSVMDKVFEENQSFANNKNIRNGGTDNLKKLIIKAAEGRNKKMLEYLTKENCMYSNNQKCSDIFKEEDGKIVLKEGKEIPKKCKKGALCVDRNHWALYNTFLSKNNEISLSCN